MNNNFRVNTRRSVIINRSAQVERYFNDISKYNVLSTEEEVELFEQYKNGDERVRKTIIEANQRFVVAVASKFANNDNILDLVSEGNIGLMTAMETFDPTRGIKFISYAVFHIRKYINDYVNFSLQPVQQTNYKRTLHAIKKINAEFYQQNHREPTPEEITDLLEKRKGIRIPQEDVYSIRYSSIDKNFSDDDTANVNENEFDTHTYVNNLYEDAIEREDKKEKINDLLTRLTDDEKSVVQMYYGLCGFKENPLEDIAYVLGVSTERCRQFLRVAIKKMSYQV